MKIIVNELSVPGNKQWFHPAFSRYGAEGLFFSAQEFSGADCYGDPVFSICSGNGNSIPEPGEIPPFVRSFRADGLIEAVADIRPFEVAEQTVAILGCSTFYHDRGCAEWREKESSVSIPKNDAVCCFRYPDGHWSEAFLLDVDGIHSGFRTACTQICQTPDGDWIIPFYAESGRRCEMFGYFSACFYALTVKYRFNGEKFVFLEKGDPLDIPVGRGFCEPSVTMGRNGMYYLTLRAEDGHGYTAYSGDGLHWSDPVPWHWDNGSELEMSSTQQHFLSLQGKQYLVYTRRDEENQEIFRYRAPLYVAEADPFTGSLKRETEQIVFARQQLDGEEALYGNFHVAQLSDSQALISDSALFMNHSISRVMTALIGEE